MEQTPGSLKEIEDSCHFNTTTSITGIEANEENIKNLSYTRELEKMYIHFATHGVVIPNVPEISGLVLSQKNKKVKMMVPDC